VASSSYTDRRFFSDSLIEAVPKDQYKDVSRMEITQSPMKCCGMLQASQFDTRQYQVHKDSTGDMRYARSYRNRTADELKAEFQRVIDTLAMEGRNCAMITLVKEIPELVNAAKAAGFQTIQEFYNPNSGNTICIMTYLRYKSKEYYVAAHGEDEDEDF
jgi:hypothetical protein